MEDPAVLPISLKPSNLRPLAYRIFSKKYGLNIQSSALEVLSAYIGKKIGNEWRGPKTTSLLEEIAKIWKEQDKGLFLDGESIAVILKEISIKQDRELQSRYQGSKSSSLNKVHSKIGRLDTMIDNEDGLSGSSFKIHQDGNGERGTGAGHGTEDNNDLRWQDYFKVIDTSNYKRFKYNHLRKQFDILNQSDSSPMLDLPDTKDNIDYFIDKFHLLKDKLLRNENFQPTAFSSMNSITGSTHSNIQSQQITSIKNLLGRHGNRFLLFGLLTKNSTGLWQLQDESDKIELELSQCLFPENCFFTPGNFVICDGIYSNSSKFYASSVIHPPSEKRETSLEVLGDLDFNSIYSKNFRIDQTIKKKLLIMEKRETTHKLIILGGNIYLNDLKILDSLKKLFIRLTKEMEEDLTDPIGIVFNGPFTEVPFDSTPTSSMTQTTSSGIYKSYFDSLASILEKFPELCAKCKFIFVPGDNDPWSSMITKNSNSIWPKFKIPRIFGSRLTRLVKDIEWCSNPCRLNYLSHDILIARDDTGDRFRRNDISYLSKLNEEKLEDAEDEEKTDEEALEIDKLSRPKVSAELFQCRKLVKTLLDQGNLTPFPLSIRPVLTNYGSVLSLIPLPTLLILTDPSTPKFDLIYENCHVLNPGQFYTKNKVNYMEYYPSTRKSNFEEIY